MMLADWKITITRADITLAIALLGAVLGIINMFVDLRRNRIRLRVVPKLYTYNDNESGMFSWDRPFVSDYLKQRLRGEPRFCIEVQNISNNKAVTVSNVGLARKDATDRCLIMRPLIHPTGDWPRRLEPNSSFTAYSNFTPQEVWKDYGRLDYAIAETETQKIFKGTSPILEQLKKQLG